MTFIIAEAGVNHQGRLDHALELIRHAAAAGCDAVKFQAYTPWVLAPTNYETQAMLKGLALTGNELRMLHAEAGRVGIEFMCTPMDEEWLAFVVSLGVKRIKVGSGQAMNLGFVSAAAATKLPVIISNGMMSDTALDDALCAISAATDYTVRPTVLSCISKYPTPDVAVNLSELERLRSLFPYADVGFSCHSRSMWPSVAAVYAGAVCVEKHICLNGTSGPDISSSLPVDELAHWVKEIRRSEKARGG